MFRVFTIAGWLFFSFTLLQSCSGNDPKKKNTDPKKPGSDTADIRIANTGFDAVPRLRETDSIQVLYYDDPDGDSVRYSRFYKYTITTDSLVIQQLLSGFEKSFNESLMTRACRSEGKMYLFADEREVKTIYFSTRCDSCCYLYFIRDGRFLYVDMNDTVRSVISKLKKESRKP